MARRVCFLVDGFNVYHSLVEAQKQLSAPMKWLDVGTLCRSYLSTIGKGATFERVFYFSAPPDHFTEKSARHAVYMRALRESGVTVQLGRFKNKTVRCQKCKGTFTRHEEKETDVAVAVKLLELFHVDACDVAVIMTGDTDIAPAIRTANALWPNKETWIAFPHARHNAELKLLVANSLNIKAKAYARFQLPDPVVASDRSLIAKPAGW